MSGQQGTDGVSTIGYEAKGAFHPTWHRAPHVLCSTLGPRRVATSAIKVMSCEATPTPPWSPIKEDKG